MRGAVRTPLPLLPCVVLQSAIKFINLTVPSSAGRIGMNLRFLQRMGVPTGQALAAGRRRRRLRDDRAGGALLRRSLRSCDVDVDTGEFSARAPTGASSSAIGVALLVSVVAVLLRCRSCGRRSLPAMRRALSSLWSVARDPAQAARALRRQPRLGALSMPVALGATCLAYGVHLNLAQLVFVNTAGLRPLEPDPGAGRCRGGRGEPAAGLIAMGVDESTRLRDRDHPPPLHLYLPPIWGYASSAGSREGIRLAPGAEPRDAPGTCPQHALGTRRSQLHSDAATCACRRFRDPQQKGPICGPFAMELAELEPATSWVRSSRPLTSKVLRLQRFMGERLECGTSSPTVCTASLQRQEILDRAAGAIERTQGEHLHGKEGVSGSSPEEGLPKRTCK